MRGYQLIVSVIVEINMWSSGNVRSFIIPNLRAKGLLVIVSGEEGVMVGDGVYLIIIKKKRPLLSLPHRYWWYQVPC